MKRPRVMLHIGRNKVGSTSIQDSCARAGDTLAAHSIGYGLFGHLWDSDPDLPGWVTFDQLASHAHAHPDRVWLVSNEFMSAWGAEFTREAGRALSGCDVTVIVYLRRYDDWVCSAYAEDTRNGANRHSIDDFVEAMYPRISALPNITDWAECFGWDRMRVRSIHPADLEGGDLLGDFGHAIGVADTLPRIPYRNTAPGWAELELIRHLARSTDGNSAREAVPHLVGLMRMLGEPPADAAYLDPLVRIDLLALYAADAAALRARGQRVTTVGGAVPARPFLPAFETLPTEFRCRFLAAATASDFTAAHPVAAAIAASWLPPEARTDGDSRDAG